MKGKYKLLMLLMLILFCVGSVCAAEPDNNITISKFSVINGSSDFADINSSDKCLNDSDMTNQDLLIKMFQGKIKCDNSNNIIGKLVHNITAGKSKEKENHIYNVQLKTLSKSIINNLNTIDYEINKTLNDDRSCFNNLIKKIDVLKRKNLKNPSIAINNSLKECDKCLNSVNTYFYTFKSYLNQISDYLVFKKSLRDQNISINDNDVLNIDNSIINSINSKVKCLYVLKCKLEDIATCLNSINSIVKL